MQSRIPLRLIALAPVWFGPILYLMSSRYFGREPELLGLPQGFVLAAGTALWALIGVAITWRARSWLVDVLAVLVFTIPAVVMLILGPAVILILQNLGAA
jgi:hypothetical protein